MDVELFILDWIQAHLRHPLLDPVMVFITTLGNAGILWIALTILLALKKSTRKTAAALAIALMLCLVSGNLLLKPSVGRIRPFHAQELVTLLIETPTDYSFPSGHTMSSFAAATVLLRSDKRMGIPAMILAALIGFSRLYLYVHYPTDVLAGLLMGCLLGWLAVSIIRRRTGPRPDKKQPETDQENRLDK